QGEVIDMANYENNKQPTVLKEEEPDPSVEIIDLRQKLAELEGKYQRSLRATEAEKDCDRYRENLIDKSEPIENSKKMNELNQKVIDVTRELEEERRRAEEKTSMINELAAKLAKYEENQTIFGGMLASIEIPDELFPAEIMTQNVELHMFPLQASADDFESGERNDDREERVEMDGEASLMESRLTDLFFQLFEGEEMDEKKIKEMITMMENMDKEKIANAILKGLLKVQPKNLDTVAISSLLSTLTRAKRIPHPST
ncbi:hypothetical protein PMAYCL1PPCAC_20398, partial [Pristionchus mayeri]